MKQPLSPQRISVLRAVETNGAPMSRYAIAKAIDSDKSTVGKLVAAMLATGHPRETKGRSTHAPLVTITKAGRAALAAPVLSTAELEAARKARRRAMQTAAERRRRERVAQGFA